MQSKASKLVQMHIKSDWDPLQKALCNWQKIFKVLRFGNLVLIVQAALHLVFELQDLKQPWTL